MCFISSIICFAQPIFSKKNKHLNLKRLRYQMMKCQFHHGFQFEPTKRISSGFHVESDALMLHMLTDTMTLLSINMIVTATKETDMDTFKQFLQRKAATKRAELADINAQAKRAEADEQRKKANTMTADKKKATTISRCR